MFINIAHAPYFKNLQHQGIEVKSDPLTGLSTLLMMVTGVHRLYTREDFSLFFYRLAVLGKKYGLFENFFLNNNLLKYTTGNGPAYLDVNDCAKFIGLRFSGSYKANIGHEAWSEAIPQLLKNVAIVEAFSGIILFEGLLSKQESTQGINATINEEEAKLAHPDFENAALLSESIMKELPVNMFDEWTRLSPTAFEDWKNEETRIANIKQYDYNSLDDKKKRKIIEHFNQFFEVDDSVMRKVINLSHLAWAYANNHIYRDSYGLITLETYVQLDEMELDEGYGVNLDEIFDNYSLNDLWDLLIDENYQIRDH